MNRRKYKPPHLRPALTAREERAYKRQLRNMTIVIWSIAIPLFVMVVGMLVGWWG